jgi:poly(A) polymerase
MVESPSLENKISERLQHSIFKAVQQVTDEQNIKAFAIGGFVRDLILDRPCKDIDVVVSERGPEIAKAVANKLGVKKVTIFKTYGTAMFKFQNWEVEFVGARKESYSADSRNPEVSPGTLEDDQKRRDFTINALAISLNTENYGAIIDPFEGTKHLTEKVLKTPLNPDITYSDDPLRMMRAIRFASQLEFKIEEDSFEAIKRNKDRISIISQERITTELNKIVLSKTPSIGFKLLFDSGLLAIIFPEMQDLYGVEGRNGKFHKDNFYHTLQVLDNISENTNDLWLRWAAILHDIAKPPTKRFDEKVGWTFHGHEDRGARMVPKIFKKLKLPLDHKMKYVQKLVALHLRPIALTKEIATDSAIRRLLFDVGDDLEDLLTLCQADITSKNEEKVKRFLSNYEQVKIKITAVEEKDRIRNWQPPVSGEEIMELFKLKPCREVGTLKEAVKDAILDGDIQNDREAALEFLRIKANELGLK